MVREDEPGHQLLTTVDGLDAQFPTRVNTQETVFLLEVLYKPAVYVLPCLLLLACYDVQHQQKYETPSLAAKFYQSQANTLMVVSTLGHAI